MLGISAYDDLLEIAIFDFRNIFILKHTG